MRGRPRRAVSHAMRRLGGAWHRFRAGRIAEKCYRTALALDPSNMVAVRRSAEARQKLYDLSGAVDVYSRAIRVGARLSNRDLADCLRRRAALSGRLGDWAEAAEDYRRALRLEPSNVDVMRFLTMALERSGDTHGAIAVARAARAHFPASDRLARWLANALGEVGDWHGALRLSRELTESQPGDLGYRTGLAAIAARAAEVPFAYEDGEYVLSTAEERREWFDMAVGALNRVVSAAPSRVRDLFMLGTLYERDGRAVDAAERYTRALDGLRQVDAAWTHRANLAWRFRLDYVSHRLGEDRETVDSRVDRSVRADADGEEIIAGFVAATIGDHGLSIQGFVLPDGPREVVVECDGVPLKTLPVDEGRALPGFGWTVLHPVLELFPSTSRLTVRCGETALLNTEGGASFTVEVPGGAGKLGRLLDEGYAVNKKGRLSPPGSGDGRLEAAWLGAYEAARSVFRERFGRELFAVYGTLLGVWRDGAIIRGDDDFDVAFLCRESDPMAVRGEIMDVMLGAIEAGFDVRLAIDGRPFHLGIDGVGIDVNPVWFHKGRCWSFAAHNLTPADFEPCDSRTIRGVEVAVPRRPEAFLRDTYGPDWGTPTSAFRYYRSSEDLRVLRRIRLTRGEVEDLRGRVGRETEGAPDAGRFLGHADPNHPSF
ncbi:tetratricopeptide repeat protein [Stackebrandtia soli]|uniref:tetratricopeptide repeat protein n=1 Tax=Stackebrandtia soli TaxID=1892856 RepID=UPI0039E9F245